MSLVVWTQLPTRLRRKIRFNTKALFGHISKTPETFFIDKKEGAKFKLFVP